MVGATCILELINSAYYPHNLPGHNLPGHVCRIYMGVRGGGGGGSGGKIPLVI